MLGILKRTRRNCDFAADLGCSIPLKENAFVFLMRMWITLRWRERSVTLKNVANSIPIPLTVWEPAEGSLTAFHVLVPFDLVRTAPSACAASQNTPREGHGFTTYCSERPSAWAIAWTSEKTGARTHDCHHASIFMSISTPPPILHWSSPNKEILRNSFQNMWDMMPWCCISIA